jgi:ribosomal protein S20
MDQIFYVLSSFLRKDSPIYLFDKYGRFGHLVNQDRFYAFQPIEISDEKVSMYERSKPVDFRHDTISLELPTDFSESKVATQEKQSIAENSYESIIRTIVEQIELASTPQTILAEEKNWFKNASKVLDHMRIVHQFTDAKMREYMVYHAVDVMSYVDKRVLFEHVYNKHVFSIHSEIETLVAKYLQSYIMKNDRLGRIGTFLARKEDNVLLVLNPETGAWSEGDEVDQADFADEIADKYLVNKRSLNTIIGYAMDFKGQEMSFYYKDITLKRNKKGRRCDR